MRKDLKQHLIAGFLVGFVPAMIVGHVTGWWVAGSITAAFVGAYKEWVWDKGGKGVPDGDDFRWTWAGGFGADAFAFLAWIALGALV